MGDWQKICPWVTSRAGSKKITAHADTLLEVATWTVPLKRSMWIAGRETGILSLTVFEAG